MEALSTVTQDDSSGANPSSVKSDDSSPQRDSGSSSPPPNCAICLCTCKNKSFTDSCLHQFCFSCLLTWSKVKAECPLCKQAFRSIIHNVRSNHQYEEYLVVQRQNEETSSRIDIDTLTAAARRFRYRTTLTLPRRETIAIQQLLLHRGVAAAYPLMAEVFPPAPRRRRSPDAFRRTVYRHNLWARPLPDFTGRFRDCSPDFYRYNDTQMHRLVPWLNRELNYLLNENIGHISYVMSRILELLREHHINSPEFKEAMQRYFGDRTEHFLHELYCFASTPYDMTGYDRNVQYTTDSRISTMVNQVISSSDSEASVDSDIVVMVGGSEAADTRPGPSRPPAPVYPHGYISRPVDDNVIPIETISHSDTDDDSSEVMVVGYIKPPQERTPEVVDLLGSDSDVIVQDTPQAEPPRPSEPSARPESRPAPTVKLTLKRQVPRENAGSMESDSDDSSYTPPLRLRRRRSADTSAATGASANVSTTTSASAASSATAPLEDWGSGTVSRSSTATSTSSSSSSSLSTSTSWSSSTSYSSSDESVDRKSTRRVTKRKSKKRRGKESSSSKDRKKIKKRSSCSNHRDRKRLQVSSERDKRSKRKSNSGKGVKSTKKMSDTTVSVSPQTSTASRASTSSRRHKSSKDHKRRRRDSRERKRLRSVVNIMYNKNNTGESNSSENHLTNKSSNETDLKPYVSESGVQKMECTSDHGELPGTSHKRPYSSDSEDDLPLNLTLQKITPHS